MTGRKTKEWVGKTADSKIPDRVRDRIFETHGKTCHVCKGQITPGQRWDTDHVVALKDWTDEGHGNREFNLAPAHDVCHLGKTAKENSARAPISRKKQKHNGSKKPKGEIRSQNNLKAEPKKTKIDKAALPPLGPGNLARQYQPKENSRC